MTENELPKVVVLNSEVVKAGSKVRQTASRLNSAYSKLCQIADLGTIPADPKDCTPIWLDGVIAAKMAEVDKLPLPGADKDSAKEHWESLSQKAMEYVKEIVLCLDLFPFAYIVADGSLTFTNIDDIVKAQTSYNVPEVAQLHYDKFCRFYDALLDLRQFEKSHNVKCWPLYELIRQRKPEAFALGWVGGGFVSHGGTAELVQQKQVQALEGWS